jgi:hypothetical protein
MFSRSKLESYRADLARMRHEYEEMGQTLADGKVRLYVQNK